MITVSEESSLESVTSYAAQFTVKGLLISTGAPTFHLPCSFSSRTFCTVTARFFVHDFLAIITKYVSIVKSITRMRMKNA